MTEYAVQLKGVGKVYRHFTLADIDLDLATGSIMGLIGTNGAGKSTTIRILMGLVRQDCGSVTVLDRSMPQFEAEVKAQIGYVSEDLHLYQTETIAWHMGFIESIFPDWDGAYARELVRRFDLKPEQKVKGLSHGQRVKAALLLALARRPRLLVLDEPTTGLDPVARHEVLSALIEVLADERRTVLFSSQNTMDVEQISDRITFIDGGRIIDSADKEDYLDRWRRLRLDVPAGVILPQLPGLLGLRGSGRVTVATVDGFNEQTVPLIEASGARVNAVDHMTLEEIFVANVQNRRETVAA